MVVGLPEGMTVFGTRNADPDPVLGACFLSGFDDNLVSAKPLAQV